jgi:hypothetical protein
MKKIGQITSLGGFQVSENQKEATFIALDYATIK